MNVVPIGGRGTLRAKVQELSFVVQQYILHTPSAGYDCHFRPQFAPVFVPGGLSVSLHRRRAAGAAPIRVARAWQLGLPDCPGPGGSARAVIQSHLTQCRPNLEATFAL